MRYFFTIFLIIFLNSVLIGQRQRDTPRLFTPRVEVDVSACNAMFSVLTAMKKGESKKKVSRLLDSVLQTKPYRAMFKHYNRSWRPNHLPTSVFKRMILSLRFAGMYSKGENQRADQMLVFWMKYYTDLASFRHNLDDLKNIGITAMIAQAMAYSQSWLPPEFHLPNTFIPILPNGGSPAFTIDTVQGYDFFQLPRDSSGNIQWNDLAEIVSHESHHLGMRTLYPKGMNSSDSIAYEFLTLFVGEGTATKFINNYPGGYVPAIDKSRDSSFSNPEVCKLWQRYTEQETEIFLRLIATFERAYSGSLSYSELQKEISEFWLSGYVSPVYFVGSELFGAVYHGYGKEGAFTAIRDLRNLFALYNKAVKENPHILSKCYLIPDSTVQHALSIGRDD